MLTTASLRASALAFYTANGSNCASIRAKEAKVSDVPLNLWTLQLRILPCWSHIRRLDLSPCLLAEIIFSWLQVSPSSEYDVLITGFIPSAILPDSATSSSLLNKAPALPL